MNKGIEFKYLSGYISVLTTNTGKYKHVRCAEDFTRGSRISAEIQKVISHKFWRKYS